MNVQFYSLIADEGSIVVFAATDLDTDRSLGVAVDHRLAQDIATALDEGEFPEASIESWQVVV